MSNPSDKQVESKLKGTMEKVAEEIQENQNKIKDTLTSEQIKVVQKIKPQITKEGEPNIRVPLTFQKLRELGGPLRVNNGNLAERNLPDEERVWLTNERTEPPEEIEKPFWQKKLGELKKTVLQTTF